MRTTKSFATSVVIAAAALFMFPGPAVSQEAGSRTEEQAREQEKKARAVAVADVPWLERQLLAIEKAGGFGVARGLTVAFGDIKRGSGIALGPAYGRTFASGAVLWAKAEYSTGNYKLLQASLASPAAGRHLWFSGRLRWQDAPGGLVFPLGPDAPNVDASYAETKTELSGAATARPVRLLRFEAGGSVERYKTELPVARERQSFSPLLERLPGAGANPRYLHGYSAAAIDSRDSEGYTRRGSLLTATVHGYHDQNGPYSFRRVDGAAEQYVSILQGNSVFYVGLRASTTFTAPGHSVPFFLLPDLGGHDLRGFTNYRFRDRHSVFATAEYRWYAQEYLDAVIFYDAGKTVPDRSAVDLSGLKRSVGAGIRLHNSVTTALRLEVARSHEGLRLILAFGPAGG